jgi:hypothetical protein
VSVMTFHVPVLFPSSFFSYFYHVFL